MPQSVMQYFAATPYSSLTAYGGGRMSAVQQPPRQSMPIESRQVIAPDAATAAQGASPNRGVSSARQTKGTPAFLRQWNVLLLVLVAAFAVVGSVASVIMRSASETTANSTAPALIGVQDMFASLAEANTAATAAFLSASASGTEDRNNRQSYESAIARASTQTEDVSAIIGSDETAHDALKDIGIALNQYSGQVEAARLANANSLPGADTQLRAALDVVQQDVGTAVTTVTDSGQEQLTAEQSSGRILTWAAIALGVLTLLALLWVQSGLLKRTNRIFNPLLVVATVLIAGVLGYLIIGPIIRGQNLEEASTGGYDAIAQTAEIQTAAFNLQSQLSLTLLDQSTTDLDPLFEQTQAEIAEAGDIADSVREDAAVNTLEIRWDRYQSTARQIEALAQSGDTEGAITLFQGEGLSTFNGLNTAIESVLSDNRTQFRDGVNRASSVVNFTPILTIIGPVLAALAIMLAIQRRLGEYR